MIGPIHKMHFGLVESAGGPAALAEVKRRAGIAEDRHFGINEVYDDAHDESVEQVELLINFVLDAARRGARSSASARTARPSPWNSTLAPSAWPTGA